MKKNNYYTRYKLAFFGDKAYWIIYKKRKYWFDKKISMYPTSYFVEPMMSDLLKFIKPKLKRLNEE